MKEELTKQTFTFLLFTIILIYIIGMFVPVMDVDAAQYASISLEMLQSKFFIQVHHHGSDYLDKPPLLFWLSAISFSLLGVSDFTYKLPSVLFSLLAISSLFNFSKLYYKIQTARLAALILASCQAVFLINNDCRTDTILLGSVMFSIWQLAKYIENKKLLNLIFGSVGVAFAMLSKGPIGIMVPILAIGTNVLLKRQFSVIKDPKWILSIFIIAILLLPMCWGLYKQYGNNGIKFYFWTQSFGRITGENNWRNESGYFFFVHTFLWSFLPWSIIFIPALFSKFKSFILKRGSLKAMPEFYSIGGFVMPFLALSFSKYKLPHYIFVVYPMAALLLASYIDELKENKNQTFLAVFKWIQTFIVSIILIGIYFLFFIVFDGSNLFLVIYLLFIGGFIFLLRHSKLSDASKTIFVSIVIGIFLNLELNSHFYPALLNFQGGTSVGKYVKEKQIPLNKFFTYKEAHQSLNFETRTIVHSIVNLEDTLIINKNQESLWVYTNVEGLKEIESKKWNYTVEKEFNTFAVTRLSFGFLDPKKREGKIKKTYLIKL